MSNVLGIDLGGKAVGLAIVEQPGNRVLWCGTVHLSDKIKDLYDLRRTLRRARRSRVRYRRPKVQERGGGSAGTETDGCTYFYSRARGLNQSLRTECKHVDPESGEICGKNTPKLANIRHLMLADILGYGPFAKVLPEYKKGIQEVLASRDGITRRKQRLADLLGQIDVAAYLKKQIADICFNALDGRAQFCTEHFPLHHTQTATPTQAAWLPPSIKLKQDFLLKQIRHLAKQFPIGRIVIERANFDLQKIAAGSIEDPAEYQQGHRFGFRNTRAAVMQEYAAHCCYCGKSVAGEKWHVDHVDPQRTGEVNRWDNLAIACEKCNHKKGGRTPAEAGMAFAVITEIVAGRKIRRSLGPKPIEGSRIHKYMTQTDQGVRVLKKALREL
ncbi:MAG: RRXRR domain-containing protein, partial [Planctomycetota bacterium]